MSSVCGCNITTLSAKLVCNRLPFIQLYTIGTIIPFNLLRLEHVHIVLAFESNNKLQYKVDCPNYLGPVRGKSSCGNGSNNRSKMTTFKA